MKPAFRKFYFLIAMIITTSAQASSACPKEIQNQQAMQSMQKNKPEGWSFDFGGQYTWVALSTPPTFSGSTGGVMGKITYQKPREFFGQLRTVYNIGPLKNSENRADFSEWYTEFVGGYSCFVTENWSITPYAGLGLDFLHSHQTAYSTFSSITLHYAIYYAVGGLEVKYTQDNWMIGLQADCLPMFNEYLQITTLSGVAWKLTNRVGAGVRIPVAYRYAQNFWLELTPYYRYLPIGSSSALGLPERNVNQAGAFVTFRFFL
jgi:hypothetical protein